MISQKRREYLLDLWFEETNKKWTQAWRNELTQEEHMLVNIWDSGYSESVYQVLDGLSYQKQNKQSLAPHLAASGFFHTLGEVRMMYEGRRAQSPFDDSAADRLRRMGLADDKGNPDKDAIAVCSCIFAGQFFDDLCDYYESYRDVRELITNLSESAEDAAGKQKFLMVCLQYDAIYRTLPDPVWWISGNPSAAELFAEGFVSHLKQLNQDT